MKHAIKCVFTGIATVHVRVWRRGPGFIRQRDGRLRFRQCE